MSDGTASPEEATAEARSGAGSARPAHPVADAGDASAAECAEARAQSVPGLARSLFLATLALVYLIAFASLWAQVDGLFGRGGLAPIHQTLERLDARFGSEALWRAPSLLWGFRSHLLAGNAPLHTLCGAGVAIALAALVGVAPRLLFFLLWGLYLSFVSLGDVFLRYQWDALLLEAGLLALFVAPGALDAGRARRTPVSRVGKWLLRFLLFRLMFLSGMVKLLSGDPTWRDGSALQFHYWTQPLPAWTSYYADALPAFVQVLSTGATLAIEILLPFLIFAPGRFRIAAFIGLVGLQLAIAATGNYGFFNLLTLALCFTLLDDATIARLLPGALREGLAGARREVEAIAAPRAGEGLRRAASAAVALLALLLAGLASLEALDRLGVRLERPSPLATLERGLAPLRSVNSYGLFAVMTTERREIAIEGSRDGRAWRRYAFRWKPGALERAPAFSQPHMPRIDWQMWFASLRGCERSPWFRRMLARILEGEPAVLSLLAEDPFGGEPPRYLRTPLARYRFDHDGATEPGRWWRREPAGFFCPTVELAEGRLRAARLAP